MATHFYNRSSYRALQGRVEVPTCFLWLDQEIFDKVGVTERHAPHRPVMIAEMLCRRMADIDFFAQAISTGAMLDDISVGTALVSTYLVAYLSACKGFLDAIAIAVNELFELGLRPKQQDLGKAVLITALAKIDAGASRRYAGYRTFVEEVIAWRNVAVHRLSPLAVMYRIKPGPPKLPWIRSDYEVRVHREPGLSGSRRQGRCRLALDGFVSNRFSVPIDEFSEHPPASPLLPRIIADGDAMFSSNCGLTVEELARVGSMEVAVLRQATAGDSGSQLRLMLKTLTCE